MRLLKKTAGIDRAQADITAVVRVTAVLSDSVDITLNFQTGSKFERSCYATALVERAFASVKFEIRAKLKEVSGLDFQPFGLTLDASTDTLRIHDLQRVVKVLSWLEAQQFKSPLAHVEVTGAPSALVRLLLAVQPDRVMFIHDPTGVVFLDRAGSRKQVADAVVREFPCFLRMIEDKLKIGEAIHG